MISNLEKDVSEWRNLKQLNLAPMVEAELECLVEQIKKNYLEIFQEVNAIFEKLKTLDAREVDVTEMMVISGEVLDAANTQLKQAEKMIARANAIISRVETVRKVETARLEEITAESIQIQLLGVEKKAALEEIKSRLEK